MTTKLERVFTWCKSSHVGLPEQWNGGMLRSQTTLLGVELFSYINSFFCTNKFALLLAMWVKLLCYCFKSLMLVNFLNAYCLVIIDFLVWLIWLTLSDLFIATQEKLHIALHIYLHIVTWVLLFQIVAVHYGEKAIKFLF